MSRMTLMKFKITVEMIQFDNLMDDIKSLIHSFLNWPVPHSKPGGHRFIYDLGNLFQKP